jgi:hypothetical protein
MQMRLMPFLSLLVALPAFAQANNVYYVSAFSSAQAAVNQACMDGGGTIHFPLHHTLSSQLAVTCNSPIELKGGPTVLTCNTGATTCIKIGNDTGVGPEVRGLHAIHGLHITGPGRMMTGSVGIDIRSGDRAGQMSNVTVDSFDIGIRVHGDVANPHNLGYGWSFHGLVLGFDPFQVDIPYHRTVNTGIHLDGHVGEAKFSSTEISAYVRCILSDGPGGTGADAKFVNTRCVRRDLQPGDPGAIEASASDGLDHVLVFDGLNIEVAYPAVKIGNHAKVHVVNLHHGADIAGSGARPFFLVNGNNARLNVMNSRFQGSSSGTGQALQLLNPSAQVYVANSLIVAIASWDAVYLGPAYSVVLSGNEIEGGISLDNARNVSIVGNSILRSAANAIRMTGSSQRINISSNRISGWDGSRIAYPAVEVVNGGTQTGISIRGNMLYGPAPGAPSPSAVRCGNAATDQRVEGNSTTGLGVFGACTTNLDNG